MALINCKCPSCGATLQVDHKNKMATCDYCHSTCLLEDAINHYNIVNNNHISNSVVNIYGNTNSNEASIEKAKKFLYVLDMENAERIFKEIYAENPDNEEVLELKDAMKFGWSLKLDRISQLKDYFIQNKQITEYEEKCIKARGREFDSDGFSAISNVLCLLLDIQDYNRIKAYSQYVTLNIHPKKLIHRTKEEFQLLFSCDINKTLEPYQKSIDVNYNNDSYKEYIKYYSKYSLYDVFFVQKEICNLIEQYYPNETELQNRINKENLIKNHKCIHCGSGLGSFKSNYSDYRGKKVNFFNSKGCNNPKCPLYHEFQDTFYDPFYISKTR